ncbi:hypothetical protein AXF42_Ash018913 [Apostasia shenzhenica]|uniref:Secreted protein n=1 Tax=Apostasia shenzhenica TaxID=1088818 RepID=A0A2I0B555_9ASPA|nr:hypothetical protein AXF42_Ash018913 [Apostasia shenzhenica]
MAVVGNVGLCHQGAAGLLLLLLLIIISGSTTWSTDAARPPSVGGSWSTTHHLTDDNGEVTTACLAAILACNSFARRCRLDLLSLSEALDASCVTTRSGMIESYQVSFVAGVTSTGATLLPGPRLIYATMSYNLRRPDRGPFGNVHTLTILKLIVLR